MIIAITMTITITITSTTTTTTHFRLLCRTDFAAEAQRLEVGTSGRAWPLKKLLAGGMVMRATLPAHCRYDRKPELRFSVHTVEQTWSLIACFSTDAHHGRRCEQYV